ncbi:hypothetical protein GCM10009098_31590 [Rheinheimera aquimaris]|uniref:Uncharacterized protein n=1 Tax=Rheinheimera aquimaris TaxID=412437 RepID=A0ABN1E938_9GAMM
MHNFTLQASAVQFELRYVDIGGCISGTSFEKVKHGTKVNIAIKLFIKDLP